MVTPVTERNQLEEIVARLKTETCLVLDLLMLPPDGQQKTMVGMSLAPLSGSDIFYIPLVDSCPFQREETLWRDFVLSGVCSLIDGMPLIGEDLVNISSLIRSTGEKPRIVFEADVMVEGYITGRFPKVDLESLARSMYSKNFETAHLIDFSQKRSFNPQSVPQSTYIQYGSERIEYIQRIHEDLYPEILKDERLKKLYEIEMHILPVAAQMEEVGIKMDFDKCESEAERLINEADKLSEELHGWLKRNFDIENHFDFGSSPQTADLITDRLHIADEVKTARGNRSTSKKNYEGLRDSSPIIDAIFTIRELIKVATAFYRVYPKYRKPDNRLHPRLLTAHVISGRTASKDPNIQQIPRESIWEFVDFEAPESDRCVNCQSGGCKECSAAKKRSPPDWSRP